MKRARYVFLGILAILCIVSVIGYWIYYDQAVPNHRLDQPSQHPPTRPVEDQQANIDSTRPQKIGREPTEDEMRSFMETEAIFYGKVVDQFGNPVPNAQIRYSPTSQGRDGLYQTWFTHAGADGKFSIQQKKAPSLRITVEPPHNYYPTDQSLGTFDFAKIISSMPEEVKKRMIPSHQADLNNPVIFTLKRMGRTEPLVHRSESIVPFGDHDFTIGSDPTRRLHLKFWIDPTVKRTDPVTKQLFYDWSVELSVPNGGIVERVEKDAYEAPANGYKERIRLEYSSGMDAKDYRRTFEREYFLRFTDGRYGRAEVRLRAKPTRSFVVVESWLNPSGGTATEFDPSKQIPLEARQRKRHAEHR